MNNKSYKVISGVLGVFALGCFLQAFGILPQIVNWLNSLPRMIGR